MKIPEMNLPFPEEVLNSHAAVLGKTGAGKSSAMRAVAEHLLDKKKRVVVIDPKGDWWGLKSSADGKGPGYPIVTFGDFKSEDDVTDVPINEESGKHLAELVTEGNRPAIIGFRGWFTSHMLKFWIDFAKGIFHGNSGELYLLIDEVQNFAPKGSTRNVEGQGGLALHWTNRLLAEGRGLGINIWIGSQRPQKVHNDTLDGCETLVAMRSVHPAARGSINDWMKGAADKEKSAIVLDALGDMKRGEAVIWSPESKFGPDRVIFPMFTTFDSFAPPQLQKKVHRKGWADVDLAEVRAKLATVIEEAKQNDPKELRQIIANLERGTGVSARAFEEKLAEEKKVTGWLTRVMKDATAKLGRKVDDQWEVNVFQATVDLASKKVEVPVLKDADFKRLEKLEGAFTNELMLLRGKLASIAAQGWKPTVTLTPHDVEIRPPAPHPDRLRIQPKEELRPKAEPIDGLSAPQQRILDEMAKLHRLAVPRPTIKQIAVFCGVSHTTGSFLQNVRDLDKAGYIARGKGDAWLTEFGFASSNADLQGMNLVEMWKAKLDGAQSKMLATIILLGQSNKAGLAQALGLSPTTGSFLQNLRDLRNYGIVEIENGVARPSDLLKL